MRVLTGVLSAVLSTGLLLAGTGCDDEEATGSAPTPESPGETALPDNLCELVAPQVSDDWELEDVDHSVKDDISHCTLASEDTRVIVTFTSVPEDELESALAEACDMFVYEQPKDGEIRCIRAPELGGRPSGNVTEAVQVRERSGVAVITMQTDDLDRVGLVGAEVASVEAAFVLS